MLRSRNLRFRQVSQNSEEKVFEAYCEIATDSLHKLLPQQYVIVFGYSYLKCNIVSSEDRFSFQLHILPLAFSRAAFTQKLLEIKTAKFRHFILSCGDHAAQVIGNKNKFKEGSPPWECRCKL